MRQMLRTEGRGGLESHRPHHRVILPFHWLMQTALVMLMADAHQITRQRSRGLDLLKDHVNIPHRYAHQVDYQRTAIASRHDDHNRMVCLIEKCTLDICIYQVFFFKRMLCSVFCCFTENEQISAV